MALLNAIAGPGLGRSVRRWAALLALAFLAPRGGGAAEPAPASGEYQIKAVFLFNFAQFAEWPAKAFANARAPFVIGILGDDPFGAYLDELVKEEKVGDRPLVIRRYRDAAAINGCHILFVSHSEAAHFDAILERLKHESVLTIGDSDAFTRAGGMVRFVMEGGKVRLRINVEAARACGLTISSKILRPATIVTSGRE